MVLAYYASSSPLVSGWRRVHSSPRLEPLSSEDKLDEALWEKFKAVAAGNEMAVKSCYEK
jgi:hypothetical protein